MDHPELQDMLDFIAAFTRDHGFPPSYSEIAEACRLGSVGHVQYRVNRLIAAGRLTRTPGCARSLRVVRPPPAAGRPATGLRILHRLGRWLRRRGRGAGPQPRAVRGAGRAAVKDSC